MRRIAWISPQPVGRNVNVSLAMSVWASALLAAPVHAQSEAPVFYNISTKDLGDALNVFAAQSDEQIVFATEVARGKLANSVYGRYTPREALDLLLRGSGLHYRIKGTHTYVIQESPALAVPGRRITATQGTRSALESSELPPTDSGLEEVVVTGSRISNPAFVSPTPLLSISMSDLERGPPKLFDLLTGQPKFRGSTTNTGAASTISGQYLNLRSLGPARTLVLLNGVRLPVSQERGGVDVALIPEQLVSRVDVITGGASAAYGSDAIAGAVNFVLDTRFEGLRSETAFGTSTYGDGASVKIAASFGTGFASGNGHFIFSAFGFRQDGISPYNTNRAWFTAGATNISSPPGVFPSLVTYSSGVRYLATPSGVITAGPLAGTTFGAGGVPRPYSFGTPRDTTYQLGGDGAVLSPASIIGKQERFNAFGHLEYDVSDSVTFFAEATAAREENLSYLQPQYNITANAVTIYDDNAYLTPEMRSRMQSEGVASFRLENIWTDSISESALTSTSLYRARAGLRGAFASEWTFTSSFQISRSKLQPRYPHTMQWKNLFAAVDAVISPITGQIVCRSTLEGLTPGCVPINLMGPDSKTAEALDYVRFAQARNVTIDELSAGFSSQRPMFSLWAGHHAILAAGIEHRTQEIHQTANTTALLVPDYTGIRGVPVGRITNPGFDIGGFLPYSGRTTVTEGFAELNVPIVDKRYLAHSLSLNAAVRYTKYDPSGPATTYKLGVVYEPVRSVLMRASLSRDMRAPSLYEMFLPRTPSTNVTVVTPFGVIQQTGFAVGNPDLNPERAYGYTLGVVYQPSWLPGFGLSIDYFNIKLQDGIATVGTAQQIADACYRNYSAFACSLITLAPDRSIATFSYPVINNTTQETDGVDFEATYRAALAVGRVAFRARVSFTPTFTSAVSGAPVVNIAGQVGHAKWAGNASVSYSAGSATFSLTERYKSPSLINVTFTEGVQVSDNHLPSVSYLDAAFLYDFSVGLGQRTDCQAYLQISNLLNKDPALVPASGGAQVVPTNFTVYDGIGRYFTTGLRVRW